METPADLPAAGVFSFVGPRLYSQRMPTVYLREANPTFHSTESCIQLTKRPAQGKQHPVLSAELAELNFVRPCKTCYPDAPRIKVVRRFCPKCNYRRTRPCEHNGGVRVTTAYVTEYVGLLRDPGDEITKTIWVWPDQVHFYDAIASHAQPV